MENLIEEHSPCNSQSHHIAHPDLVNLYIYDVDKDRQIPSYLYWPLPRFVLENVKLSCRTKLVLAHLYWRADREGWVRGASTRSIGAMVGMDKRSVLRHREKLVDAGLLYVTPGSRPERPDTYRINLMDPRFQPPVVHVPSALVQQSTASASAVLVYTYILYRNGDRGPRPIPLSELASAVGLKRRAVANCMTELGELGLIVRSGAKGTVRASATPLHSWMGVTILRDRRSHDQKTVGDAESAPGSAESAPGDAESAPGSAESAPYPCRKRPTLRIPVNPGEESRNNSPHTDAPTSSALTGSPNFPGSEHGGPSGASESEIGSGSKKEKLKNIKKKEDKTGNCGSRIQEFRSNYDSSIERLQKLWSSITKNLLPNEDLSWDPKERQAIERLVYRYGEEEVQRRLQHHLDTWSQRREDFDSPDLAAPVLMMPRLWRRLGEELSGKHKGSRRGGRRGRGTFYGEILPNSEYNEEKAKNLPKVGWGDLFDK